MLLLKTLKQDLFFETVLVAIIVQSVAARPQTSRNENYHLGYKMPILEGDIEGEVFQRAMHRFLYNNEHKELRNMLKLALNILDNQTDYKDKQEFIRDKDLSEMPFYFDYINSLVNGDASNLQHRKHRKRSSFDSIGHNGGLDGLGGSHRPRKLEFTFENLLPYLLQEMRRRNRDLSEFDY